MKNRKPAYLWIIIVVSVIIFLAIAIWDVQKARFYFTSIDNALISDDIVWGINSDNVETTVFRVSVEDGIGDYLSVPLVEDKRILTISDPFIYDAQVYFRKTLYDADGKFTEKLVCWNLDKNRLDEVEIPGIAWKSIFAMNESVIIPSGADRMVTEVEPPEDSKLSEKGNVQLCVRKDGDERLIDCVQWNTKKLVFHIINAFIVCLLLCVVFIFTTSLASYYHVYPGLLVRMGLLVLFIMLLMIYLTGFRSSRELYKFACDHAMYYCADAAYVRASAVNEELLDRIMGEKESAITGQMENLWKYDLDEGYAVEELEESSLTAGEKEKDWRAWDMHDDHEITEDSCVILIKDEELQILYDHVTPNSPWLRKSYLAERKYIDIAFSENQIQGLVTTTGRQRYAVSLVPIELESGTKVLVATRIPMNSILTLIYRMQSRTLRIFLILGICSIILVLAGIMYALLPIDILKEAFKGIAAGDLSVRAECKGFNELFYLAKLFNQMADRLETQSEGTDSYRTFYDGFIPASLLKKLSGRSVSGAMIPKAVYQTEACSIVIKVQGNDSFEERILLIEDAIRIIEGYGSHMTKGSAEQLKLICTDSSEKAFRAVTNLQQNLASSEKSSTWVGMAFCPVRLCVIGNDKRMNVVEQDPCEAEILSEIAAELKIPVILTEALYLDAVRHTAKLHFRCLGRIGMGDYTPDAPLYELLDANTAASKAIREYSRTAFEQGVNAYASGDYFRARNEMIRALELDPEDLAARCYVLNCDRKEPPTICQVMKNAD